MPNRTESRLCSDYLLFTNREAPFNACDAVALSQLAARSPAWLKDYYVPAFNAVVQGLRLRHGEAALNVLTVQQFPQQHPLFDLTTEEVAGLLHLVRLRQGALSTVRFGGGFLLGDAWLRSAPYRDRPYQSSLRTVHTWWEACDAHIVGGIELLDQAICSMLRWDISSTVTIDALRRDFGYPDPGPVRERWLDSF